MTDQGEAAASARPAGDSGRGADPVENPAREVIGVGIVDDDAGFAETLASFVELDPAFVVVGIADSVASARELVADPRAHLVLIDVNMPDGGGLALVEPAPLDGASRPVLVLISAQEPTEAVRATPVDFVPKHDIDHVILRRMVGLDLAS